MLTVAAVVVLEVVVAGVCHGATPTTSSSLHIGENHSHPNFQFLLLALQLVQLFDELDVFFQDPLVLLSMLLCLFQEFVSQGPHIVLDLTSLLVVNLVNVSRASVVHSLIEYPRPVEPHHAFLQLFVTQVVLKKHLLDVVFEPLHCVFLSADI